MTDDVEARRARLFEEFAATGSPEIRDELVESYLPLADYFARRYRDRSVELEDLRQVARLGLVNAIDRFDHTLEINFSTFAGRTIDGELKRWFRDKSWAVRVPRSIQENTLVVGKAISAIEAAGEATPTPARLAEETGLSIDEVIEALDARANYRAARIDRPTSDGEDRTLGDTLATDDDPYDRSEITMVVGQLLETLPDREREIIRLRFFDELSQQEIADRVGVSQMHVSRLIRRALESLQATMRSDDPA